MTSAEELAKSRGVVARASLAVCVALPGGAWLNEQGEPECVPAKFAPLCDPAQHEALSQFVEQSAPRCALCGRPSVGIFGPWAIVVPG